MICTNKIHSIKIDTMIIAHKNLKDTTIKNISFFIKVKKVSVFYIYCYDPLLRMYY
jgi:hypothetical protein